MPASTSPPQQQIIRSPRSGSPSQETHPVASTSAHTLEHQPPPLPEPEPSSIAAQSEGSAAQIKQEAADLTTQALAGSAIGAKAEARAGAGAGAGAEAPGAQPQLNEEDARLLASLATSGGFFADLAQLSASAGTGIGLGGELKSENGVNPFEGDGKQEMGSALGWPQVAGSSEASLAAPGLRTGANLSEAMDVDTRDDGTSEISEREDAGAAQGPIQAYAKLEFPGFSYYIQTLDVSIGRRAANAETGTASVRAAGVDVDLGPLKSISRMHARIFYDPAPALQPAHPDPSFASASASGRGSPAPYARYGSPSFARASPDGLHGNSAAANGSSFGEGRFVLQVLGRNGAFVDDVFVGTAGIVPLGKR